MLDEGGLALLCDRARRRDVEAAVEDEDTVGLAGMIGKGWARAAVFGHAIYEALACGEKAPVRAAARIVDVDTMETEAREVVRAADDAIAALLSRGTPIDRTDFVSIEVDDDLG